ncbi:MAG: S8 family serine peptidase [Candidatus Schekmanbacteria bacterium]|nr:S8 family serine peptidase [Candidatus Schekmanbacteria bacterium]
MTNQPHSEARRCWYRCAAGILMFLGALASGTAFLGLLPGAAGAAPAREAAPATVIVKFREEAGPTAVLNDPSAERWRAAAAGYGAVSMQPLHADRARLVQRAAELASRSPAAARRARELAAGLRRTVTLSYADAETATRMMTHLSSLPEVEWVELDRQVRALDGLPDDPRLAEQWGLHQDPTAEAPDGIDIDAPEAWAITTGDPSVILAVLDTGLDGSHPDFDRGRLVMVEGWDLVNEVAFDSPTAPYDDAGHGTHVAGIASAASNNGTGIAGVCWQCRVMPLKVLDAMGSGTTSRLAAAIAMAAGNGARVVIMSLGFATASTAVQEAVAAAEALNTACVAAAGNWGTTTPTYPAAYDEVIAAGAIDSGGARATFSNRGEWVSLYAPGTGIWSTLPGGAYAPWSGTSMAAPFVGGALGLLATEQPSWTPRQLGLQALLSAKEITDPESAELLRVVSAGRALTQEVTPRLVFGASDVSDSPSSECPTCDGDRMADEGETVQLLVYLDEQTGSAQSVTGTLSSSSSAVTISQATAAFAWTEQDPYRLGNDADPFVVTAGAGLAGLEMPLLLSISLGGAFTLQVSLNLRIDAAEITGELVADTVLAARTRSHLVGFVHVNPGARLKIESGATVQLDKHTTVWVDGEIQVLGAADSPVVFEPANSEDCEAGGCQLGISLLTSAVGSVLDDNGAYVSGSLLRYADFSTGLAGLEIAGPPGGQLLVDRCTFAEIPGEVVLSAAIAREATFDHVGGVILSDGSVFDRALVYGGGNGSYAVRVMDDATAVQRSSITGNDGGLGLDARPELSANSLVGNALSGGYDLVAPLGGSEEIDATGTYWATTDSEGVEQRIFDFLDSFGRAEVAFAPVAESPDNSAPSFPIAFAADPEIAGLETVTLTVTFAGPMAHNRDTIVELVLDGVPYTSIRDVQWPASDQATATYPVTDAMPDGTYEVWLEYFAQVDGRLLPRWRAGELSVDTPLGIARGLALGILYGGPALGAEAARAGGGTAYDAVLTWQPVAKASAYVVSWGPSAASLSNVRDVGGQTLTTFPALFAPGDTYCFSVRARKASGSMGTASETLCQTAPGTSGVPIFAPGSIAAGLMLLGFGLMGAPRSGGRGAAPRWARAPRRSGPSHSHRQVDHAPIVTSRAPEHLCGGRSEATP